MLPLNFKESFCWDQIEVRSDLPSGEIAEYPRGDSLGPIHASMLQVTFKFLNLGESSKALMQTRKTCVPIHLPKMTNPLRLKVSSTQDGFMPAILPEALPNAYLGGSAPSLTWFSCSFGP